MVIQGVTYLSDFEAKKAIMEMARRLEAKGWLAIYKNPVAGKSLAIGMAREYPHISDRQLQTLQRLGIDSKIENISSFL